jgi:hypothetical protein
MPIRKMVHQACFVTALGFAGIRVAQPLHSRQACVFREWNSGERDIGDAGQEGLRIHPLSEVGLCSGRICALYRCLRLCGKLSAGFLQNRRKSLRTPFHGSEYSGQTDVVFREFDGFHGRQTSPKVCSSG